VTLIPGDGVGPEVVAAAKFVLDRATSAIDWEEVPAGEPAIRDHGSPLPGETLDSLRRTRVGLKGPIGNPGRGYASPNMTLRYELGLWCNLRIAQHFDGARSRFPGTKLVIVRDVMEDAGRGAEQMVGPDAGVTIKFITRQSAERVAEFACSYARLHGYRRITIANQAPSQRLTDGLFLSAALDVGRAYDDLAMDEEAMDALSMHLAMHPQEYEILLAPNLYGGILCGLASGLAGGVGLMPGVNLDGEGSVLFEAGHGSVPKYAGQDKVNPTGMILSGAMLLAHIGEADAARAVEAAVAAVIRQGRDVTYDLGGDAGTARMAEAVVAALDGARPRALS
jgi:isocitrate dehydrogenase (NAD+)